MAIEANKLLRETGPKPVSWSGRRALMKVMHSSCNLAHCSGRASCQRPALSTNVAALCVGRLNLPPPKRLWFCSSLSLSLSLSLRPRHHRQADQAGCSPAALERAEQRTSESVYGDVEPMSLRLVPAEQHTHTAHEPKESRSLFQSSHKSFKPGNKFKPSL